MTKERPQPLPEGFQFTESEKLFGWISEERFQQYLTDSHTTIHQVNISTNSYGEFCFTTLSRTNPLTQAPDAYTLYGYGYHEYRDRYFIREWRWYQSNTYPDLMEQILTLEEAQQILQERKNEIEPFAQAHTQSQQGKMFEMLAEISDDDGAISDFEDLPSLFEL